MASVVSSLLVFKFSNLDFCLQEEKLTRKRGGRGRGELERDIGAVAP